MKTIILFRHAKSDWSDPGQSDFDRPLNNRGERDAPRVGAWLARRKEQPDLVLCSTAERTRATLQLVLEALPGTPEVRLRKSLYLASAAMLFQRIAAVEDARQCVMVVGHNPGLEDLAVKLMRPGSSEPHSAISEKFPTAAVAILAFDVAHWRDVAYGRGRLVVFQTPKALD